MKPQTTGHPTPSEQRASMRAEFARVLRRSLDRHDITQAQLADAVGVAASKVGRWTDHRVNETPCVASLALLPRPVAIDLLTWIGAHHHATIADDLSFGDDVSDHLAHFARLVDEINGVSTTYARALADGGIDPAERRVLIAKLRASVASQTTLLRDLEGEEAADRHGVARRPAVAS